MPKIYLSDCLNPYENIATERMIFKRKEEALFLWVNEPSVIVGANQNIFQEVNLAYAHLKNIHLVRRFTGGGAVYHDRGNLNFSFFTKTLNKDYYLKIIQDALMSLGLKVYSKGRNDLYYEGFKVSGLAYLKEDDFYLFHGTLMVDVDLKELAEVLYHRAIKYHKKAIPSHLAHVQNLSAFKADIHINLLKERIVEAYKKHFQNVTFEACSYELEDLKLLLAKDFRFNAMNDGLLHIAKTYQNEVYDLYLKVDKDLIVEANVYSDSLNLTQAKSFQTQLLRRYIFDIDHIFEERE